MKSVTIIGAGASGLVCAIELERAGFRPTIIERSNKIGGRLRTTEVNGFYLDHGFQVLLTDYPAVREYLDLNVLQLNTFLPGADIFVDGEKQRIGDAHRNPSFLFPTLFAKVGSVIDKLKILQLSFELKQRDVETIFADVELSTLEYLKSYGFSDKIIDHFFRPFYSGIFLENKLATSSRMFKFVFKMFAEGSAAIPEKGIAEIANQLSDQLSNTSWMLETNVERISSNKVLLGNGEEIESDIVVVASNPSGLLDDEFSKTNPDVNWLGCSTFYFEYSNTKKVDRIISLVADKNSLISSTYVLENVANKQLLSVTVIDNELSKEQENLELSVRNELKRYCKIEVGACVANYYVPQSLPVLSDLSYEPSIADLKQSASLYICGDQTANASLNAAMLSGKTVAKDIIQNLG